MQVQTSQQTFINVSILGKSKTTFIASTTGEMLQVSKKEEEIEKAVKA